MTDARHLSFHGLAIKRLASADAVASVIGLSAATVAGQFEAGIASGRVIETKGGYTLSPLARVALEASYGRLYGSLRDDARFEAAYQRFEAVNRALKQVITDWQTVDVRGERVINDHGDQAYDDKIIDRLACVHDKVEPILRALSAGLPRLSTYADKLTEALEKAEDGDIEWVSDIRRESYHTVWFELHEDLLRIMGTVRDE
jgi:hypothetical protein